jgi:hypothetical protein
MTGTGLPLANPKKRWQRSASPGNRPTIADPERVCWRHQMNLASRISPSANLRQATSIEPSN